MMSSGFLPDRLQSSQLIAQRILRIKVNCVVRSPYEDYRQGRLITHMKCYRGGSPG